LENQCVTHFVLYVNRTPWNYREQKWDIEEGETYEGDTDEKGTTWPDRFAKDHEGLEERL